MIDPEGIHVLIDAEPLASPGVTPFAFAALLAKQSRSVPGADIQATADIWAFPTSGAHLLLGLKTCTSPGEYLKGSKYAADQDSCVATGAHAERSRWANPSRPTHPIKTTWTFSLTRRPGHEDPGDTGDHWLAVTRASSRDRTTCRWNKFPGWMRSCSATS